MNGRRSAVRRAWAWTQPLGAVLVLVLLVRWLGADPFLTGLRGLGPGALLAAAAICAATTVCSAWRWRLVARSLGVGLPLRAAVAAYYRSQFLNSVLPGGVLGDVHRGVRHGAAAGNLGRGLRAVVWERVAGQAVQAAVALVALLLVPFPLRAALPVVVAVGAAALAVVLLAVRTATRRGPARVRRALRATAAEVRTALLRRSTWPALVLSSVLVVCGHLGVFFVAATAAGVSGPPQRLLPPALVVLLAASCPLNVAGWGPREGVAAWVFAVGGWGAGTGTSVATAFGVLTAVSTLPGLLVLVAGGLRSRDRRSHDAGDSTTCLIASSVGRHPLAIIASAASCVGLFPWVRVSRVRPPSVGSSS